MLILLAGKKQHDETLAREIRSKLAFHRITMIDLGKELGKAPVTISVWLSKKTTQERYDVMNAAISRIISKGDKPNGH